MYCRLPVVKLFYQVQQQVQERIGASIGVDPFFIRYELVGMQVYFRVKRPEICQRRIIRCGAKLERLLK